mmetsp:Transcript_32427/g.37540  ORF Transcript_32427/g.37540 Transcript_32427/m.37540 type:complete len:649 (+) Transcript_32427:64-2010(+)
MMDEKRNINKCRTNKLCNKQLVRRLGISKLITIMAMATATSYSSHFCLGNLHVLAFSLLPLQYRNRKSGLQCNLFSIAIEGHFYQEKNRRNSILNTKSSARKKQSKLITKKIKLNSKKSIDTGGSNKLTLPPLLTLSEERDLLQKTVEYRRIKDIESELVLSADGVARKSELMRLKALAKASGYSTVDLEILKTAITHGEDARETLVTRNMGLVYYVVNNILQSRSATTTKTKLQSLTKDDLVQEGSIGLSRAVDKYNPRIAQQTRARFATYGVFWIRAAVLRCIAERDDLVRAPEHVSAAISKLRKAAQTLGFAGVLDFSEEGRAWREAEIAKSQAALLMEETGLSITQINEALKVEKRRMGGGYTSLEPWMQCLTSVTEDSGDDSSVVAADNEDSHKSLRDSLGRFLRPKEMEALSLRYGFGKPQCSVPVQEPPLKPVPCRDYIAEAEYDLFGTISTGHTAASSSSAVMASVQTSDHIVTSSSQHQHHQRPKENQKSRAQRKATQKNASGTNTNRIKLASFRDYLAEAEYDIFGSTSSKSPTAPSTITAQMSSGSSLEAVTSAMQTENAKLSKRTRKVKTTETTYAVAAAPPQMGRWGEAMSFQEIGKHMAISAEYGRRLTAAALEKLQRAAEDGQLEPDLLLLAS